MDDNQPQNGRLSLVDANVDRTDQIPDGGGVQTPFWEVRTNPANPSVLDYFKDASSKRKAPTL
jgi:hypothetical protein